MALNLSLAMLESLVSSQVALPVTPAYCRPEVTTVAAALTGYCGVGRNSRETASLMAGAKAAAEA